MDIHNLLALPPLPSQPTSDSLERHNLNPRVTVTVDIGQNTGGEWRTKIQLTVNFTGSPIRAEDQARLAHNMAADADVTPELAAHFRDHLYATLIDADGSILIDPQVFYADQLIRLIDATNLALDHAKDTGLIARKG